MAQTNKKQTTAAQKTHEGAPAKKISNEQLLRRSILSCLLWEGEFYEDGVSIATRIMNTANKVNEQRVHDLAIEARQQYHLRHAPMLLALNLVERQSKLAKDTIPQVVTRADQLSEMVALYWMSRKRPLTNQLKKGLARAFTRFDEYALAKYDRAREIKLRDVMFMTHPKPQSKEQEAVFKRLAEKRLQTPDTWEVRASKSGQEGKSKKQVWEETIDMWIKTDDEIKEAG